MLGRTVTRRKVGTPDSDSAQPRRLFSTGPGAPGAGLSVLLRSVRGERRADQRRKGYRAGLPHDCRAVVVDRALADAQVCGDVLAGMAGEDKIQDLTLTRRQAGDLLRSRLPPRGDLGGVAAMIEGVLDAGEQILVADRLLD